MEEEQRSSRRSEGRGVRIPPFLAGCFAGTVTTALLQPMDLVKTHIQANPSGAESYRAVVRQILSRREGVRGLWRGTGPACLRVGFGAGFYFTILGPILKAFTPSSQPYTSESESESSSSSSIEQLRKRLPFLATFSAGALSRSLAAVLVCPITVVKTRMESGHGEDDSAETNQFRDCNRFLKSRERILICFTRSMFCFLSLQFSVYNTPLVLSL